MPSPLICAERIRLQQRATDKTSAIRAAGRLLADTGCIDPAYIDSLLRRETVANTFLGHGVAIPHGMGEDRHLIRQTGIAVLQFPDGLEWHRARPRIWCLRLRRSRTSTSRCCAG